MNADIHIYLLDESWTKPVKLINTVFVGQHRETPAIVKHDGVYYFFSSKASGWYPSQAMYAYATQLDGVWTPLYEIGNSSTFDAQVNHVKKYELPDGILVRPCMLMLLSWTVCGLLYMK